LVWVKRLEVGGGVPMLALSSIRRHSAAMVDTAQIESMSVAERLQLMEQLWNAILRETAEPPSPQWHGEILARRKARAERGEAEFLTLEELRTRLRGSQT